MRRHFAGLARADALVTVSEFTKERLVAHLPTVEGRVFVVPNGVDRSFLDFGTPRPASRRRIEAVLSRSLGQPTVLYVGSESPRKNLPFLFECFRALKSLHPGAMLLKIGAADHPSFRRATMAAAGRLGLRVDRDIVFREGVGDEELLDLYRAADVFVTMSRYEGFGLPALEAMAVGTPVVVSDRGALPDVVGSGGQVVRLEVPTVVAAIEDALKRAEFWSRRASGRAQTFSWERSAAAYLSIMERLVTKFERP